VELLPVDSKNAVYFHQPVHCYSQAAVRLRLAGKSSGAFRSAETRIGTASGPSASKSKPGSDLDIQKPFTGSAYFIKFPCSSCLIAED